MQPPTTIPNLWLTTFPALVGASPEERAALLHHGRILRCPPGVPVATPGQTCEGLAMVVTGTVRVYQMGENGHEITLYRIDSGQSCVMTASCILSHKPFPVLAVTESALEALIIPAGQLRDWIGRFPLWRDFVFGLMADRLAGVISVVEEVAFRRMDTRIAEWLLKRSLQTPILGLTHQDIALELGTAREVVSRILKDLERAGVVTLGRGSVTVQDRAALAARVAAH